MATPPLVGHWRVAMKNGSLRLPFFMGGGLMLL